MKLVQAGKEQLGIVLEIIGCAQKYLALQGINQWQNGYPNEAVLLDDMDREESYLVRNDAHQIIATAMFSIRGEPTYGVIDGKWLTDATAVYGVLHRMAVHDDYRGAGAAQFIFGHCEAYLKENNIESMRIDTHLDNKGMQQLLEKMGYRMCGKIGLADGSMRLAYEKLLV
ncbi:GNAT family N-acetyltransferase [Flavobacterium sp.]